MAWLAAVFAVGTLGFWILAATASIIVIACLEYEDGFKATVTVGIFVALMALVNRWGFTTLANLDWRFVAMCFAAYVIAGTVWSVVKWYFYVSRIVERYNELKTEWLRSHGYNELGDLNDAARGEFKRAVEHRGFDTTPQAFSNKATILMWMTYWPFSAFWTLINDPVKKLFRIIYRNIASLLQGISDRLFRDIRKDMEFVSK